MLIISSSIAGVVLLTLVSWLVLRKSTDKADHVAPSVLSRINAEYR